MTLTPPLFVLIVEDEQAIIDLLKLTLVHAGHRIAGVARTGSEAVELMRTTRVDLIILDLEMPGMGGLEAARAILAERTVPIIISTGRTDPAALSAAREMHIQAFLVKPFSRKQLESTIALAVAQHAAQQQAQAQIAELKRLAETAGALPKPGFDQLGLTKRETQVLRLIATGKSNAEIAAEIGAATRTVDKHVENILAKLGVNTRTAAVARALHL